MKTIEEAAKSHEFNRDLNGIGSLINKSTIASFKAGAEFAQRWIPVEKELPKENCDRLLVKTKAGRVYLSYFNNGKFSCSGNITHWRPIEIL